jgi:LysM repeat protein
MFKKIFQALILAVLVLATCAGTGRAEAWTGCGSSYYVNWGDTLYKIAAKCGTSMAAIRSANPGLVNWVYAGQTLRMPGSADNTGSAVYQGSFTHTVTRGETLKIIAARYGTTWDVIARLNGLFNPNLIYPGERLQIPSQGYHPAPNQHSYWWNQDNHPIYITVQRGYTLLKIAGWFDTTVYNLQQLNHQLPKSHLLNEGMLIRVK